MVWKQLPVFEIIVAFISHSYKTLVETKTNSSASHERHECDMSAKRVRHEQHECDTSATRVKNFNFDNDTIKNIFSHPNISYISNEKLQGEEHCRSKNYLLEMPCSHTKMCLKSAPQKMNFVMAKAITKVIHIL